MNNYTDMETCKHKSIVLFPDYASYGMWCGDCGIGFVNPIGDFPLLGNGLIDIIDGWNALWELANDHQKEINVEHFNDLLISMGNELALKIDEFYPCKCDVERTKLIEGWSMDE